MNTIPTHWENGERLSAHAQLKMVCVRMAGCICELPLLGVYLWMNDIWLPRCRLCNCEFHPETF